jgi:hypothetical protein
MVKEYINVDLTRDQKSAILEYAGFFVMDETTRADLSSKRRKWIKFSKFDLSNVIGELSYCFNRCNEDDLFHFLDELISHLEVYEQQTK